MVLRSFRNAVLKRTAFGRGAVWLYYRLAPWLSRKLSADAMPTRLTRWVLEGLVNRLEPMPPVQQASSVPTQHDSASLGVCAYAPRLERAFTVMLQVLRGRLTVLPRDNPGAETERLMQAGYLVAFELPTPFPNAFALDELLASREIRGWLEVIGRGARVTPVGVRLNHKATHALERLRLAITYVPVFDGEPQPVRTSLELWMHWYSPRQFGSDADEFRDAPVLTRSIVEDARRYGIDLIEDKRQIVVFN